MEIRNNFNRYTKNYSNNRQNTSFQGFVDPRLKKVVNFFVEKEIDNFISSGYEKKLTEADFENIVATPVKNAYKKLSEFMEKLPDDVGVRLWEDPLFDEFMPEFFVKHVDNTKQLLYGYLTSEKLQVNNTRDFIRFVTQELGENKLYAPSKITKDLESLRIQKANELLKEKLKKSKNSYLD